MKRLFNILLYLVILTIMVLAPLEILVRIWGYSTIYLYDPIYMPCPLCQEIPFVLQPNLRDARAHGNIRVNTDALGLRSPTPGRTYPPKTKNDYRIVIMGDSVTFGVGVPVANIYPEVLQDLLNQDQSGCRVQVFNFGVSSYSIKEMALTLKHRVPAVQPDLVIMALVFGDFDLARTPGVDKWGYNTRRNGVGFLNNYPTIKLILRNVHLSYLLRDIMQRSVQKRRLSVAKAPGVLPDWVARSYPYALDFQKTAEALGYRSLILLLPSVEGVGGQFAETIEHFKADRITYFDISPITRLFTPKEFHASRYDWHPSAAVHHKMAEMLGTYIKENFLPARCGGQQQGSS